MGVKLSLAHQGKENASKQGAEGNI